MSQHHPVPPPEEQAEIAARVRRRMAPTVGACALFAVLAAVIVGQWVHQRVADERIAAEARIESCERGNAIRVAQRASNLILAGLLETVAAPPPDDLVAARQRLLEHLAAHPADPVALHAAIATRPNPAAQAAVAAARAELARQDRVLRPVDCTRTPPA